MKNNFVLRTINLLDLYLLFIVEEYELFKKLYVLSLSKSYVGYEQLHLALSSESETKRELLG